MSHTAEITTEVRDLAAITRACRRLDLGEPVHGTFQLYSSEETGYGIKLCDWKYPVVCQLETGQLRYDNFGGRWGDQQHLDAFLQRYAVEKATIEARKRGHSVIEQQLDNGSVKLTINVGGAA